MKPFNQFINESVLDIPRNTLDPTVFQFEDGKPPILNPAIKQQIITDVHNFEQLIAVTQTYIVGSILTRTYSPNSDIDVNVEVNREDIDDLMQAKLSMTLKAINGKLAVGTVHPINYYIMFNKADTERFDAIYDVPSERWLKEPSFFEINIDDYTDKFQNIVIAIDLAISKLRRELIDYDQLIKLSMEEVKDVDKHINNKLKEITQTAKMLIDIQKSINTLRRKAFLRPLTPELKEKYPSRNLTPENIIYKLLHKYHYWDLVEKLEKILNIKKQLEQEDIQKIKDAQDTFTTRNNKISFETFIKTGKVIKESTKSKQEIILERIRDIKLNKVDWKSPKSRKSHMYKLNRGLNRQHLRQVPLSHQTGDTENMGVTKMLSNIGSAQKIVNIAKKTTSGLWRLTPQQVKWLSHKYHHIPPNAIKNIKHLGNTGIMVWRKSKNNYFLVKHPSGHI
jgi:predicted nucleotidyltransferase